MTRQLVVAPRAPLCARRIGVRTLLDDEQVEKNSEGEPAGTLRAREPGKQEQARGVGKETTPVAVRRCARAESPSARRRAAILRSRRSSKTPFQVYLDEIDRLEDPVLSAFVRQSFTKGGWYDILPIVVLTEIGSKLQKMSFAEFCLHRSRSQATEDVKGVYRLFLKIAKPQFVADHLPRLAGHYFDFGGQEQENLGPGAVRVRRTGAPLYLADWLAYASPTFIQLALEAAGAKDARVSVRPYLPEGTVRGLDTVSVEFDLLWS